jgi:plasmid stability protein
MAGSLSVRNLDDDVITRLKLRAARLGRAEARDILRQALEGEGGKDFERLAAEFRKLIADRPQTPSEILLRESRDER